MLFIGLDVGTQGVRCIAVDVNGKVAASASKNFARLNIASSEEQKEQAPEDWWAVVQEVLREVCIRVPVCRICAVAVDGTSGSVVPLDKENKAICPALMYNDTRSRPQALLLQESGLANEHQAKHGYKINASFALPKIRWCIDQGLTAAKYVNQTDYIVGKLTDEYGVTDYSNALKMGYDLLNLCWGDYIYEYGVDRSLLPQVIPCGQIIAKVTVLASEQTGLPAGVPVCAGATDGYASSLAAGISKPGDWASVLGTTLVLKGITKKLISVGNGSFYSHKHPDGWWLPGGASNAGGRYLDETFGKERFEALNSQVPRLIPSGEFCYPFTGIGERFPFDAPTMKPFCTIHGNDALHYAAAMEGVGYVERMAYEMLEQIGVDVSSSIFTTGGGCRSPEWLDIRASILGRQLKVPRYTDAAIGVAMLAAAQMYFGCLSDAVANMCEIVQRIDPVSALIDQYNELYGVFCRKCAESVKEN